MCEVMIMSILFSFKQEKPTTLNIDENNETVTVNGKDCPLTHQEYCLLCQLAQNTERVVSRDELLMNAWGYITPGMTRTVDVHVQRLRKKLGASCIETVYRMGYRLVAQPA